MSRHYFRYLSANLLNLVAGVVSFLVMTRLLTEKDYGIFGYFELYALIWVAILKLGTQQSTVRLYPAYCLNRDAYSRKQFYTTLVLAPAFISTLLFGTALLLTGVAQSIWRFENIKFVYPN
jgi:O-antigen/teichoic acid export membrane protein